MSVLLGASLAGLFLFLEDRVMQAGSWKWLAITIIFLVSAGIVELRGYRRRHASARALLDPPENPAPEAAGPTKPTAEDQPRRMCPKTPTELFELIQGKTEIQAKNVLAPYRGTWLCLEGTVAGVEENVSRVVVTVKAPENVTVVFWMKEGKYKSEALSLAHGDLFSAIGKISAVSAREKSGWDSDEKSGGGLLQLRECERVL